jgi:hypothetical protein
VVDEAVEVDVSEVVVLEVVVVLVVVEFVMWQRLSFSQVYPNGQHDLPHVGRPSSSSVVLTEAFG